MSNIDKYDSVVYVKTRNTLLERVNSGDREAFQEFYDLYCPAMLAYLGLHKDGNTERDELDIVQTVFVKFYQRFVLPQTSEPGELSPRTNIFSALVKTDKKSGQQYRIKFRQYLITCLKNAAKTKWRDETKGGNMTLISIDEKVGPADEKTWLEVLEELGVDPRALDCTKAEGERLAAVWGIWQAVIRGILLDESMSDCTRDIIRQSLLDNAKAKDLAEKWGITENYVYKIKFDGKEKAARITRAIYEMLGEDVDVEKEAKRLFKVVSSMKPSKHVDRFMISLAEKLFQNKDF